MGRQTKEFLANKGKIMEKRTKESDRKGAISANAAIKTKNAMKEAMDLIMSMKANDEDTKMIRGKFPQLSKTEIDGYIEAAVMMRNHSRNNPKATAKLIEIMGGSEEIHAPAGISIVVADNKTANSIQKVIDLPK